jgi:hypothetical protein
MDRRLFCLATTLGVMALLAVLPTATPTYSNPSAAGIAYADWKAVHLGMSGTNAPITSSTHTA